MDTISAQYESLALGRCGVSKTAPTAERIVSLPAILGFCPNMGIVNPNAIYSILLHNILFLIKILFPSIYNDRLILRNNRFYQSNIMLFESMVINLGQRGYIVFCFISILDNMDMNWFMIIRIKHESESEKYKYCWHRFFFLQRYAFLLKVPRNY